MSTKRATKRALLTSILAICLCLVMLVGSTFAWFTDTASTGVNQIKSGTLDVQLLMQKTNGEWESAENKTLSWVQAVTTGENGEVTKNLVDGKSILWEPNCTYELQPIKIVNNGNLALKYTITITGIVGDTGLNKVIEWTYGGLAVENGVATGTLLPNAATAPITISGHMLETAGNEYQNKSIDGIAITVNATQTPHEYDSISNDYDKNANMTPDNLDQMVNANVTKTVDPEKDTWFANDANNATARLCAPAGSLTAGDYTLTISPKTDGKVQVGANEASYAYDIKLLDKDGNTVTAADGKTFSVDLWVGEDLSNVQVFHEGKLINSTYNATSGKVSFNTTSFSTFDVTFDAPVAVVGGKAYPTLSAAVYGAEDGATITVLRDFASDGATMNAADKKLTINLNGHTITFNDNKFFKVYMGELTLTGSGVMQEAVPNYAPIIVMHKDKAPAVVTVGKDVTLKGWSGLMVNPKNTYSSTNKYAPVINVNGTLIGQNDASGSVGAGLYVNGENTGVDPAITVNINETAVLTGTGHGIYGAGYAIYNTCGTVTGGNTGIELRAGKLNVTGGTITGNGIPTSVESNGNGATTVGAGIAVAQHTTKLPTELTVTGGVINGYTALYQSNPEKNDDAAVAKVSLSVSGGVFNAINGGTSTVYSQNCAGFITGGTFTPAVETKYMAN